MPRGKKREPMLVTDVPGEHAMEIHVYGEYLANAVFLRIVEGMKANRESGNGKAVRFVVYTSLMHTNIRYSIMSDMYEKIELRSLKPEKGGLKDAAGM